MRIHKLTAAERTGRRVLNRLLKGPPRQPAPLLDAIRAAESRLRTSTRSHTREDARRLKKTRAS